MNKGEVKKIKRSELKELLTTLKDGEIISVDLSEYNEEEINGEK